MPLSHTVEFTINHIVHSGLTNCPKLSANIMNRDLAINDINVNADNKTNANRQPILCLHGWLDNAASFFPLAAELSEQPLLAFEFAGHGHSAHRSADSHYHFIDWVDDLANLCQQQAWQGLTIIGHSMGGMIATALAASFPELVSKLILIDSVSFISQSADQAVAQLRQGIESRQRYRKPRKLNYRDIEQAATARQAQSDFNYPQALLLSERGSIAHAKGISWRADMRLRHISLYRFTPEQANAIVNAVQCPTLAIIASDGKYFADIQQRTAAYKTLKLVSQLGGHHCHMTEPKQVAASIKLFLEQTE